MADARITFRTRSGDVNVSASLGADLLELAQQANIALDAPCGGNGTCGKCKVRLLEGKLAGADAQEDGYLLACKSTVVGDAVVELPEAADAWTSSIKVTAGDESMGTCLGDESPTYGLACDIGTTGVSLLLVDLSSNTVLAEASTGNAQVRYGADVINRIINQSKPGGVEQLQKAIVEETINPLIEAVCAYAEVAPEHISCMSIAGNTTMNHLFMGVEANSLRVEPYVPHFLELDGVVAGDVAGLALAPATPLHIAPNVGSYVGGDITAGLLVSNLWQGEELKLFIDLGTNGELVFGNNEFLMTCACSAGPAFEGGDITCGMRATEGAIEAAVLSSDFEPLLSTIGTSEDGASVAKPAGICGSGLIDLVSELFRTGALNGKGRIVAEGRRFERDEFGIGSYLVASAEESATGHAITLNEVDIENFVRAKGAIFSAIMVMLDATGFTLDDLSCVEVAGGIGSGINIKSAISIGLLPNIAGECYTYLGNTSLSGARAMVQSEAARAKVLEIAHQMTYLELSVEPGYMDAFIAACFIPHTDSSLFAASCS